VSYILRDFCDPYSINNVVNRQKKKFHAWHNGGSVAGHHKSRSFRQRVGNEANRGSDVRAFDLIVEESVPTFEAHIVSGADDVYRRSAGTYIAKNMVSDKRASLTGAA